MKCSHCEQIQRYTNVDTREKLEKCSIVAYNYVEDGVLKIELDHEQAFGYIEKRYTCTHCGTQFVLWLDCHHIQSGGEWRTLSN